MKLMPLPYFPTSRRRLPAAARIARIGLLAGYCLLAACTAEQGHGAGEPGHEEAGHAHGEDGHSHGEDGHSHGEDGHAHGEEALRVSLTEAQYRAAGIALGKIAWRNMSEGLRVNGYLDVPPQSLVSISVPFGGILVATELLPGSKVGKGQPIAVLEHPEYIELQQQYWEAQSEWEYLKADYERQESLAQQQASAAKTRDKAKADFQRIQAVRNGLKAKLSMLHIDPEAMPAGSIQRQVRIPAPISGFVAEVMANIGSYVRPGDVLFKLVDPEHLHVELEIYEQDIDRIKVGQSIRFALANSPREYEGEVFLIGKEVGADRAVSVHGHLGHELPASLMPGMYLQAVIETGAREAACVPEQALMRYEGQGYIFAQAGAQAFEMVPVVEGKSSGGYTEVGLPKGFDGSRPIAVSGAYVLLSMLKNTETGHVH
jgi:cobalt-zinc-cadmium efflux system membrane fusion protein